jgi:hypothetical protein
VNWAERKEETLGVVVEEEEEEE